MKIVRTEAGQGGRKGHSNMAHWDKTAQVKDSNRKARRRQDKAMIREQA